MFNFDEWIASHGGGWIFVFVVGALLGLRHATDPDHLSALMTLRLAGKQRAPHYLGFSWGVGHALSIIAFGIPAIYLFGFLPEKAQQILEFAVGIMIIFLSLRVVYSLATIKSDDHSHTHHGGNEHRHPHTHTSPGHKHRSNKTSFIIGILHGAGGSAGVVALLLSRIPNHAAASLALIILSAFCALSMALCSWLICRGLDSSEKVIRFDRLALVGSVGAFFFGVWYALGAFELIPYPF